MYGIISYLRLMVSRMIAVVSGYIHGSITSPTLLLSGDVLKQLMANREE